MTSIAKCLFPASPSSQLVAFVAAVAVGSLGCAQGTPTSPTGLSPALDVSPTSGASVTLLPLGKPTPTSYTYGITGDISVPSGSHAEQNVGKSSDEIVLSGGSSRESLTFTTEFLGLFVDGSTCFGTDPIAFSGALRPDKQNPSIINVDLYFGAKGTDGSTDFKYVLEGSGTPDDTFPPNVGSTTVTWIAGSFSMNTEGSGKGKRGGNAGSACTGNNLTVGGSVIVTVAP